MRDIESAYVRFADLVSAEVADKWRDGIQETIAGLAYNPRRYPRAPENFQREVRQIVYRRAGSKVAYRILFIVTGESEDSSDAPTVTILHVRHASSRPVTRTQARQIETEE
ncbi:MAG: type II toxin-antitoxin system RelE/ParE family toxin [Chthonomonadaceae bacterium]|nr:type II toxin-antitoxin system RelE/ParE family toxin [Chthonomonadaceae bacterium]